MIKNLSPRPDHLSPRSDGIPWNCYSSNSTMNQSERYMLNSSTPRWYFGLPDKNRPRSNNHRKANTSKSDDESDYDYPRESGEYASKIETIKYPPDPTGRKKKPRNDKKTRNALKHSTRHAKNNSLPDWRERVFSEQFQKDFLYKIPMRLRKSLSRNRGRRNLYRREPIRRNSLPELNLRQDIQTPSSVPELNFREDVQTPSSVPELNLRQDIQSPSAVPELNLRLDKQSASIRSRCCLWSLCIIVGVTLVLAAASVPLILRLTQETDTTYEKYSLQLSTNQTFIVEYNRKSSVPYKAFTERFCSQLERCYKHSDYKDVYYGCFVDMLGSNGPASTAVNFDIYFQSSTIKQEKVVSVLTNCIGITRNSSYGHLGEFTITLASLKLISIRYRISSPNIVSISSSSSEMTTTAISDIQSSTVTSYSSITSFSHTINDMITASRSVNQIIDTSSKQHVTTVSTGNDNTVSSSFKHVTIVSISMTQQPIISYNVSDKELYSTASITVGRQPEITPTSAINSKYSEIEILDNSSESTSQTNVAEITSAITGSFDTATKVTSTTIGSYNVDGASTEVRQSSAGFAFTTTETRSDEKLEPSPTLSISASTSIASNDKLEQTTT